MEDEIQTFLHSGADLVITKPMKPWMLDQLMRFFALNGVLSHFQRQEYLYWVESAEILAAADSQQDLLYWGKRK